MAQNETAEVAVDTASPSVLERRNSLEKHLQMRPDEQDLKDRHILLDTTAAPALQAKQAELERQRITDNLKKVCFVPSYDKMRAVIEQEAWLLARCCPAFRHFESWSVRESSVPVLSASPSTFDSIPCQRGCELLSVDMLSVKQGRLDLRATT